MHSHHGKGMRKFMHALFKKDGLVAQNSEDGRLNFKGFMNIYNQVNDAMDKKLGAWPRYDKKQMMAIYKGYNSMSEGDGITMHDWLRIEGTQMWMLHHWGMKMEQKMKPTEENMKAMFKLEKAAHMRFAESMKQEGVPKKVLTFMKEQIQDKGRGMAAAVHHFFRKGGAFDNAAGEDKRMNWEEFESISNKIADAADEKYGKLPRWDTKELKMAFEVYDSFSEEDGISKCDFMKIMHADHVIKMKMMRKMKKMFHVKVTRKDMKAFKPMYKMLGMKLKEAKEADGEEWAGIQKFIKVTKKSMGLNLLLMGHMFMKEDGVFDKMAGEDGRMSFEEFMKTDAVIRAKLTKKFGK